MKILVISHMYPLPSDEVYGIFVHKQVLELIDQGCDVRVIKPVPWAPFPLTFLKSKWRKYAQIKRQYIIDGVEVYCPKYIALPKGFLFFYSGIFMHLCIKKLVEKIWHNFKFDIIHSHVALPDGFAGMLIKENYIKKPLVVTIHGQDLQSTIYKNKSCVKAVGKVFKKADKIVMVSAKLKKIAEVNFGYSEKMTVINNGIDPEEVMCLNVNGKDDDLVRSNDIEILSVSSLNKSKGVGLNIIAISKIINRIPNIKYCIIGEGPEERNLKELTFKLGLNDRISFLGKLPHNDVINYMAMSDIFSLPSWNEGFGIVYLEAMSCGKPVIACKGEGIEDVIEHDKTGILVKPKDIDDLAHNLEILINNLRKSKSIGKRAKKLVLNKYTWEQNVKQTIRIYEEVLRIAKPK